jgi:hypothetical protein
MFRMSIDEEFKDWLASKNSRLHDFINSLPPVLQNQLDYSIESANALEAWLLEKYPEYKLALNTSEFPIIDACGIYVGEVFRKALGGEWTIELEDNEHAFQGVPGIDSFRSNRTVVPVYPRTWVTASIDRRTGRFIYTLLERFVNHMKP